MYWQTFIPIPSADSFKTAIYNKYFDSHLSRRFPNIELLKAFSIFDGQNWPDMLQSFGLEHLVTLEDHFTPTVVSLGQLKVEWEMFKNTASASLVPS